MSLTTKTVFFVAIGLVAFFTEAMAQDNFIMGARPYRGFDELDRFFAKEMVYPEEEFANGVKGHVTIQFNVSEQGDVSQVKIAESGGLNFDLEAMRLFKMLLWLPEAVGNQKVSAQARIRIDFNPKKYKKWVRKRGYDKIKYPYEPIDTSFVIYEVNDVVEAPSPIFKDTNQNISSYIQSNLNYPEMAFRQSVNGSVVVEFIIEVSGNVSNVHALRGLGGGCTIEAFRLIENIKWYPAIKEGKAVRCRHIMSVTFILPRK